MATVAAESNLLFGLLALQNGLIDQDQLVAAFRGWTRDRSRPLADYLAARGDLDPEERAGVEAMVGLHLKKHGGDAARSLAAIPAGRSTRESLAALGDPAIEQTLTQLASDAEDDPDRTASYAVGTTTAYGQRFRVLRPYAKGGLGAVFVALDADLNREVALKQILDQHADDPTSRARFVMEAEITGGLEHPGIVPVYGLGTYDGGRPFYAMRFIKGDSLKEAADRFHADAALRAEPGRRELELRKLLGRFVDVCDAIGYAHSRGVLHRDIKPGNIIVGRYGETLVVDWGLSKATGRADAGERTLIPSSASGGAETLPGSVMGTPAYMSPEQADGDLDHLGPRSDVYSLGATLYYVLTGRSPVTGDVGEMIRAVRRGEISPPRAHEPAIDPALETVCLKAMAHRPSDRYASPRALSEDIERWMADEPVTAWREPISRRARRWANRNRTTVASAVVALIAGVVGLLAVLAVQTRAKDQVTRALARETDANKALGEANTALERSKAAVQVRYDLAVGAIRAFHTGVSEDFLLGQEPFKELRDRLLRSAQEFYGKISALLGREADAASRRALLASNFELADLTGQVGDKEDALSAHRAVLSGREALAAEPGTGATAAVDVGRSLTAVAALLEATGRTDQALAAYRRSESSLAGLADASSSARAELAAARSGLGRLLLSTGKPGYALAAYRLARGDQEALAASPGAPPRARRDLADTILRIGVLLSQTAGANQAEPEYQRALEILDKLAADHPGVSEFRLRLADVHNDLASLLWKTGRTPDAESQYRGALAILEKLAADHPAVTDLRSSLALTHNNLAGLLLKTSRAKEAEAGYRRAIEIQAKLAAENPSATEFRVRLAASQNDLGDLLAATGRTTAAEAEYGPALEILEKLAGDNPDVTDFRLRLASGHATAGRLLFDLARPKDAEAHYDRAIEILQKLAAENPAVADFHFRLASSHNNLASLFLQTGRLTDAETQYRRVTEILAKLTAKHPDVTEYRSMLAIGYNNLGLLLVDMLRPSEAEVAYRRALEIRGKLAADNPDITSFRAGLARSHNTLGLVLATMGRPGEAEAEYGRATEILEKLVATNPEVTEFGDHLTSAYISLGRLLTGTGRPRQAEAPYSRGLEIVEKLAAANPKVPSYRSLAGVCRYGLSVVFRRTGRTAQARDACDAAIAIHEALVREVPKMESFRYRLVYAYRRRILARRDLRDRAGAAADARRALALLDALPSPDGEDLFEAACAHAGLAAVAGRAGSGVPAGQADAEADAAMDLLRRSVAADYRSRDIFRTEDALDPLRGRDDFRLLLMDLAMPAEPFAAAR